MEEMVICKIGYGEGISDEGWLESQVGGGGGNITDEGYLDRLIGEAFIIVDRLHYLLDKVSERILSKTTECIEEDWGLNKSTEII